jgi:hypothetical protein
MWRLVLLLLAAIGLGTVMRELGISLSTSEAIVLLIVLTLLGLLADYEQWWPPEFLVRLRSLLRSTPAD